jgi:FkbM family methyltransferase
MNLNQTPIHYTELDVFRRLQDVWVVIDAGARTDTDYLEIKPHIVCHLFEPHTDFFKVLADKVGNHANAHLNNYGLGDVEGIFSYHEDNQTMSGGEAWIGTTDTKFPIKRLDDYVTEKGITRIDFLKVDCEGYDYKVLLGAQEALKVTRYVQYEYWDLKDQYKLLLEKDFHMEEIGYRNVLCINRTLVPVKHRYELVQYIQENKLAELV